MTPPLLHVVFVEPQIPPNTGNAIRLAAVTGAHLHLVAPLGFSLDDAKLRRAGLDYHDLATVTVHPDLETWWSTVGDARTFAFSARGTRPYTGVDYRAGDVLVFGAEATGLPDHVLADPRLTDVLRIPMVAGRRSLNLSNSAAIATYEAWRQLGFGGAGDDATDDAANVATDVATNGAGNVR